MSLKPDWEDRLCPGGCGHVHRPCCDSVIGDAHQSSCAWVADFERRREIRRFVEETVDEHGGAMDRLTD